MFEIYPSALFSTRVAIGFVVVFALLQLCSLFLFAISAWEYRQLRKRHASFFAAVANADMDHEPMPKLILWLYGASTIALTILSSAFFFLQPHFL